jgi:hypothetical protein
MIAAKTNSIRYNSFWAQNYWVFGLCPSSRILKTRNRNVSETGSVSVLRWGGETPTLLGPLGRANLNHSIVQWCHVCEVGMVRTPLRCSVLSCSFKNCSVVLITRNNSVEMSPTCEAASCAATQEFPKILWSQKVHHRVHKNPVLVPILSQIDSVHTTPSCLSKIHFNIIHPPTSRSY